MVLILKNIYLPYINYSLKTEKYKQFLAIYHNKIYQQICGKIVEEFTHFPSPKESHTITHI